MAEVHTNVVRDAEPLCTEGIVIDYDEISINYLMSGNGRKPYIYKCVDTIHS